MKKLRVLKNQTDKTKPSVSVFLRYGGIQHRTRMDITSDDARQIGRTMAHNLAKKLKLNLDI